MANNIVKELNKCSNVVKDDTKVEKVDDTVRTHVDLVMADAIKQSAKREEVQDEVMKDVKEVADDLVKDTATEESKTKFKVKDRKELAGLIKEAKSKNQKYRVSRSLEEGFRYDFEILDTVPVVKTMNEEYDDETIDYKGIKIGVLDTSIGTLYEVRYNKNKGDWPEYKKLENAKKYIDILLTKGVEAADASWKIDEDKVETKDSKIEKVPPELLLNLNDGFQDMLYVQKAYNVKIDNVTSNQGLTIRGTEENLKKLAKDYNIKQKIRKMNEKIEDPVKCVFIQGRRDGYGPDQIANRTVTVSELIDILEGFDGDLKVFLNNDNGYTFGLINSDTVSSGAYNSDGETEVFEEKLEEKKDREDSKDPHDLIKDLEKELQDNWVEECTHMEPCDIKLDEKKVDFVDFKPTEKVGTVGYLFDTPKVRSILDTKAYDHQVLKNALLAVLNDAIEDPVYEKHIPDLKKAILVVNKSKNVAHLLSTLTTYLTGIKTKTKKVEKMLECDVDSLDEEFDGSASDAIKQIMDSSNSHWLDANSISEDLYHMGFDLDPEEIADIAKNELGLTAFEITDSYWGWPNPIIIANIPQSEVYKDSDFLSAYINNGDDEDDDLIWSE